MSVLKLIPRNSNLFLIAVGAVLFGLSLFNRRTRVLLIKFLGFGAGIMADYTIHKYLPQAAYKQVRILPDVLSLTGYKGGRAVRRRSFKHLKRTDSNENNLNSRFFSKYPVINS